MLLQVLRESKKSLSATVSEDESQINMTAAGNYQNSDVLVGVMMESKLDHDGSPVYDVFGMAEYSSMGADRVSIVQLIRF